MEIGKRIQQLRRGKNLTQEQMAAALGVTSAAVSKWETNAAIPDVGMLCPLARLLGITVDMLLDFHPALTPEEINALLEDRRRLFEEKRVEEAVESCEALLREYPNDLNLKCAAAGLYIMYMTAVTDEDWMRGQLERTVQLLEQCRESPDAALAANARSMLVNVYVMQEELDKAMEVLDELPDAQINTRIMRGNILLRKEAYDEAETMYQTELWTAGRNVTLCLMGLYNTARMQNDWTRAKSYIDIALAVERELRTDEIGGMAGTLQLLRSEVLCREGRTDEAVAGLTEYVDRTLDQWKRLHSGEAVKSAFYDKLTVTVSGISAAYLARSIGRTLEQIENFSVLREREDFQALLAKLDAAQDAASEK